MLVHTLLFIFDLVGFMVLKEMDIQLFFSHPCRGTDND